ncbi:MAG: arylesterase [Hyphomicrobiales bacterium]
MVKSITGFTAAIWMLLSINVARAENLSLVVLGDSLSAGYQLPQEESFPAQLQAALKHRGFEVDVQNAGVSGDTASAALSRLDWAVPEGTKLVIVELGANDALRGVLPKETKKALDELITRLKGKGARVILAGMLAPPNLGPEFGEAFNGIYPALAEKHGLAFYPFFLEGVVARPELNQADGMHPNGKGVGVIVAGILPLVEEVLTGMKETQ